MTPFATLVVLRAPADQLMLNLRDRLPEIAPALKDVESIEELERSETAESILVVNRWRARQRIPVFLQDKLGGSEISWIDRASWSRAQQSCRWQIEPSVGGDAIQCSGTTRFEPAMGGRGARAYFEGELSVDPAFVGAVVGPLRGPVTALLQSIVTTLIPANFRAAAEGASRLATTLPQQSGVMQA